MTKAELQKIVQDDNYTWIKVKRWQPNLNEPDWNDLYHRLEQHHREEVEWLVEKMRNMAQLLLVSWCDHTFDTNDLCIKCSKFKVELET